MSNENTKTSMVFYESAYAAINYLPTTELKWEATQGLLNYGFYGIEPESDNPFVNMIYVQAMPSMRNAKQKYWKSVDDNKGGRPTEVSTEEIMQMKQEGMTNKQIAAKLGCSVSNIENRVTTYKKKHPNNPNNPNNLSVSDSVSDSVPDSVSSSVSESASASTLAEEEKREIEDLEERELEALKKDFKARMLYKDIAAKYNLKLVTKEMCDSIDELIKAKVAERQEAEQRKDAELLPIYKTLATYLGMNVNKVKNYIKQTQLDVHTFKDFADANPEYSREYYDLHEELKEGYYRKDNSSNGEVLPNVSYDKYLIRGINAFCA